MNTAPIFDVAVVGGGPAGATAACDLARLGRSVVLLDKAGRIKPCGGAVPPRLVRDFDIPDHLIVERIRGARIVAPSDRVVDMPIDGGFVGMVDREDFDAFLRERAAGAGADRRTGVFLRLERGASDAVDVVYAPKTPGAEGEVRLRARVVIGADGARSAVARQSVRGADRIPCVYAYHEIVDVRGAALDGAEYDPLRCDVFYQGALSPDFYAWVFPHGSSASIGVGSAIKGFSLRRAIDALRAQTGLADLNTRRREGAPIPLKPLGRWDDGRNVVLAGDAAGVVAPASGEGIYYAMESGRLAAEAAHEALSRRDARALAQARKRFMKVHGQTFFVLGLLQHFWYRNDKRRERFVSMCADPDVQRLTWEAYMNKRLVKRDARAHAKIFMKDLGHLFGVGAP